MTGIPKGPRINHLRLSPLLFAPLRLNASLSPHPEKDELILFGGELFNGKKVVTSILHMCGGVVCPPVHSDHSVTHTHRPRLNEQSLHAWKSLAFCPPCRRTCTTSCISTTSRRTAGWSRRSPTLLHHDAPTRWAPPHLPHPSMLPGPVTAALTHRPNTTHSNVH